MSLKHSHSSESGFQTQEIDNNFQSPYLPTDQVGTLEANTIKKNKNNYSNHIYIFIWSLWFMIWHDSWTFSIVVIDPFAAILYKVSELPRMINSEEHD